MSSAFSSHDPLAGSKRLPAAARFAQQQQRAIGCFVAGALLFATLLAAAWFKTGHLSAAAIAVAVGVSSIFDMLGVVLLVMRAQAMQRYHDRKANPGKVQGPPLQIHFCRRSLGRLGDGSEPLLSALRTRGHTPVVKECLNCCGDCNRGSLVTLINGTPMSVADGDKLLGELDELAADS